MLLRLWTQQLQHQLRAVPYWELDRQMLYRHPRRKSGRRSSKSWRSSEGPKLLASTLPIYPALAKQSNTQGDVVIKATIGKNGSVAHMDVVSGPTALRQAAIDALGRWKYEPSKLDGQPVEAQIRNHKFRRYFRFLYSLRTTSMNGTARSFRVDSFLSFGHPIYNPIRS